MGVHGLWKLIEPVGKPVPLESLENKVLAVDVSIWLYQLTKGLQTTGGGAVPNAHILGLFNRICKLLYYRIKPIFVFDGGVPVLKRETIEIRKKQKRKANDFSEQIREKLLNNFLKQKAVNELLCEDAVPGTSRQEESDLFALPPLPEETEDAIEEFDGDSDTEMTTAKVESLCDYMYGKDVHSIDITSEHFKSLPPEIRHEVLSELIETRKQSSWGRLHEMKKDTDFSDYQMKRLMKRRNVQRALDEASKEMGGRMMTLGELEDLFREDGIVTDSLPGRRIAKDSVTKFIYVMGDKASNKNKTDEKTNSDEANQVVSNVTSPANSVSKEDVSEDDFRNRSFQIDQSFFINDSFSDEEEFIIKRDFVDDYAERLSREENLSQDEILRIIKARNAVIPDESIYFEKKELCASETLVYAQDVTPSTSKSLPSTSSMDQETEKCVITQNTDSTTSKSQLCMSSLIGETEESVFSQDVNSIKLKSKPSTSWIDEKTENLVQSGDVIRAASKSPSNISSVLEKTNFQTTSSSKSLEFDFKIDFPDEIEDSQTSNIEIRESRASVLETDSAEIIEDSQKQSMIESGVQSVTKLSQHSSNIFSEVFLKEEQTETRSIELFSESDSGDDFVEVPVKGNSDETKLESMEITTNPNCRVHDDDIFADVFQAEPVIEDVITEENANLKRTSEVDDALKDYIPIKKKADIFEKAEKTFEKKEILPKKSEPKTQKSLQRTSQEEEELLSAQKALYEEEAELQSHYKKQERLGSTITQQMIIEAQELLHLFGLPYVVAPMEAEAQCAFLDQASLTEGTITDDSDIWLFGGQNVYKNFFDNRKYVLQFRNLDIEHFFKLSREQLIQMALLVGSDYTVGIEGVGPVTAVEILAYFSNKANKPETEADIADTLRKFRRWIEENRNNYSSALSRKMKNIRLAEEFPSLHVIKAYLYPTVDESKETFTWAAPDLDQIRRYMKTKFAWKTSRIDDILLPVMKRLNNRQKQTTLDAFFKAKPYTSIDTGNVSERVIRAINIMKDKVDVDISALPSKSPHKKNNSKKASRSPGTKSSPKKRHSQQSRSLLKIFSPTKSSTNTLQEKIPQRERSRLEAARRKIEAAEVLRKSRRNRTKKKRGVLTPQVDSSYLSESSSEEG